MGFVRSSSSYALRMMARIVERSMRGHCSSSDPYVPAQHTSQSSMSSPRRLQSLSNNQALDIGADDLEVKSSTLRQTSADLHMWSTMRSCHILKSDIAFVKKTKISELLFRLISKMLALPPSHADAPARGCALAPLGRSSGVLNPGIVLKPQGDCAQSNPSNEVRMFGIIRGSYCGCCCRASGAAGLGNVRERSSSAYWAH